MEPYEIQASSGHADSQGEPSSGLRSFVRPRNRTNNTSSKGRKTPFLDSTHGQDGGHDDGDSKKGLTDGILQTVDYRVDFESN